MDELARSRSEELKGFDCIFIHVGTQRRKAGLDGQIKLERDDTLAVARYFDTNKGIKTIRAFSNVSECGSAPFYALEGRMIMVDE